jgi:hypothetical protein
VNTQFRLGHFSPDAPAVDIHVNGDSLVENVSFGTLSDYTVFATGMLGDDSLNALLVADHITTDADDRAVASQ